MSIVEKLIIVVLGAIILYLAHLLFKAKKDLRYTKNLVAVSERCPTTGVLTRGPIERIIARVISESERTHQPVAIMFLDLDDFKQVNDKYGHQFGNEVLKEIVDFLSAHVRPYDVVGRIGGDEFVVLLPDTSQDASVAVKEKLLVGFEKFKIRKKCSFVGLSIGTASSSCYGLCSATLISVADREMYHSKKSKQHTSR